MVDTVYIPATMTNLMRMTAYIITFLLQVAATQVNRQKCSAKTLHTSGLQVIDSSMDLQLAAGHLPECCTKLKAWYYPTRRRKFVAVALGLLADGLAVPQQIQDVN